MRILDLDLDFFVDPVAHWDAAVRGRRLSDACFRPWPERCARAFLEQQCLLSLNAPTPGRVVKRHDGAFYFLRELVQSGELHPGFDLYHVDAHPDLGMGDKHYDYIMTEYLALAVPQRAAVHRSRVNEGNYLLFLIGCRWVQTLTNVLHPRQQPGRDAPCYWFRPSEDAIALRRYDRQGFDLLLLDELTPLCEEPAVPVSWVCLNRFSVLEPFDYAVVSHSPEYTPASADGLLGVIREYIHER